MPILQALSRKVSMEFKYSGRAQNCSFTMARPPSVATFSKLLSNSYLASPFMAGNKFTFKAALEKDNLPRAK